MALDSSLKNRDVPLNPNELLTRDGQLVQVDVRDDKLIVNGHEVPLNDIQSWISPRTRITCDAPTLQQVSDEYDEMDGVLQLGDLTLKVYKGKEDTSKIGMYYLIITDSTGKPRAELESSFLLALVQGY
ncbi:MAG: hypothetical protein WC806_06255 [Candidatus Gracilibacteria bacterium]|jgi:hypothetical protein